MTYLQTLSEYKATENEIQEIEKSIKLNGYWEKDIEWRISTVTSLRIEPKIVNGINYFITTVKCEQEVMIPAATIERAVIFKNIYSEFMMELWKEQGWASWATKENPR